MTQTKAELLQTKHQGDLKLGDADSSHYVGFKAPATVGSNLVWTLPATDGSANQFLQTNASGVLSWGTADTSASMPLTGGTFTGNVTFNDGIKSRFGSDADLEVYHDGTNAYFKNATGDILFKHGSEDLIALQDDGEVQLFYDGSQRLRTNSAGIYITGTLTVSTNATITGDLTVSGTTTTINTQTLDVEDKNVVIGKVSSPSDTTADGGGWTLKGATDKTFNWVNATDAWTSSEHIHLGDNKKLLLGTGSDFSIYHDGSGSYLQGNSSGSGNVYLDANGSKGIYIRSGDGASGVHQAVSCINNAQVELYHDNSKKFETVSWGARVTGTFEASTDIQVTDAGKFNAGSSNDLQLYHNGTDSYIKNSTGGLNISSADGQPVYIRGGTNLAEMMAEFHDNGTVKLMYDNSSKLETTSGGIDVTGAITVNGAALSAAPEITGTASGSISNGGAVVVKSDGNLEEGSETVTQISNPTRGNFSYTDATSDNHIKTVWCASINRMVFMYSENSGDGLRIKIDNVTIDANGDIQGSLSPAFNGGGHSLQAECQAYDCAWDDANQILFTVYHQKSSNNTYARAWTVGSTGITGGSQLTVNSSGEISEGRLNCGYAGNGTFLVSYNRSGNSYGKIYAVSVNASTKACTKGSEISLPSSSTDDIFKCGIFGPPANDGSIGFIWCRYNGNDPTVQARALTVSGTSVSMTSSDTQLNGGIFVYDEQESGKNNQPTVSYDSDNDVYLCCYGELKDASGNWYTQGQLKCRAFRTNGTSLSTVGNELDITVPNQAGGQSDSIENPNYGLAATYGPIFNKHTVYWSNNKGDVRVAHVTTPASGNPTRILMDFGSDGSATTGQYTSSRYQEFSDLPFVGYIGTTNGGVGGNANVFLLAGTLSSNSNLYRSYGGPYANSSTNITNGSFVGFASAAYSNGNTATVKTLGNTVTKSNLTPSTLYYLNKAGNLITDSTVTGVIAGRSLTSTSLLITL
jgi:hypothetical protein